MQKITPFLWFDRNAEEAMNFYVDLFNTNPAGSSAPSKIVTIKRYPSGVTEGPLANRDGQVLTGVFELNGQRFMCLDGGPIFKPNESVSFLVECRDQQEIDHFWNRITADGMESQCGWCRDKYGFSWQITPNMETFLGPDTAASGRAFQAMMGMKKIIMADLEKAYQGQ